MTNKIFYAETPHFLWQPEQRKAVVEMAVFPAAVICSERLYESEARAAWQAVKIDAYAVVREIEVAGAK